MLHVRKILLVFIILGTLFTPILAENIQIEEIAYPILHNVSASIGNENNVEGIPHMPEESLAAPFVGTGEESGLLILKVSEDEDFESYAQLMALLGVETEAEEIPLYIYYHSTEFWDEASKEEYLSMIQESIEAKPDSGRLMMYLGDYYDRLEENKEESIRCYRDAYQLKSSDIEITFRYLIACNESDDTEHAAKAFQRIKERLQPIVHHSENNALLDKAASIYAGAISEMATLSCRHDSFSSADSYVDELRSIPVTIFSRYANGFEALGDYLERSQQLNDQDKVEHCAEMILALYEEAEQTYSESANELYMLQFIYGHLLSEAEDYTTAH